MIKNLKLIGSLSFWIHLIGFLFFITFSNPILAQNGTIFIRANKGIAYTNSGKKIRFKKMRETENSFSFITTNKTKIELEKNKIAQIDRRNGTKGFRYAATAIGVTTLVVIHSSYLSGYYSLGSNRSSYEGELLIASVFFSIITGTISGCIGLAQKRYKTIYTSPALGNYEPKLSLKTTVPNSIPSLTLSYTF